MCRILNAAECCPLSTPDTHMTAQNEKREVIVLSSGPASLLACGPRKSFHAVPLHYSAVASRKEPCIYTAMGVLEAEQGCGEPAVCGLHKQTVATLHASPTCNTRVRPITLESNYHYGAPHMLTDMKCYILTKSQSLHTGRKVAVR